MKRDRNREGGFTLMELMLVISLIGLVAVPLAGAITIGERTTSATANRLNSTHDAQLVSLYLPADIQSAGSASGDVVVGQGNTDCSGVSNLLRLRWTTTEAVGSTVTYMAAYAVTQSGGEWRLTRFFCSPGPLVETVVAHNLSGASQPAPVVSPDGTVIKVTLTEAAAARDLVQYQYTISGKRRTT